MDRRRFMKWCAALGLQMGVGGVSAGCESRTLRPIAGEVLIVGAGPAGLVAAYQCKRIGQAFRILEASGSPGGRLETTRSFVDFPVPLGAEWIHIERGILDEVVDDENVQVGVRTKGYSEDDLMATWDGSDYTTKPLDDFADLKFVGETWWTFFETYILPSVASSITYDAPVTSIDTSGDLPRVRTRDGTEYTAAKVLVTAPVGVLARGDITFSPQLPEHKRDALRRANPWPGVKAFIEFEEAFYPSILSVEDRSGSGELTFFDASHGQESARHVLGFLAVGELAAPYVAMSDGALKDALLEGLDALFDERASATYVAHVVKNWSEDPWTRCAYLGDDQSADVPAALAEPVSGKLFFAGEAYSTQWDWGGAHVACRSAVRALGEMLG